MPPRKKTRTSQKNKFMDHLDPNRDRSQLPDWVNALEDVSATGMEALMESLKDKKIEMKQAKVRCSYCGKDEESKKPLQCCSLCRSVSYCNRQCQAAHYKSVHKAECMSFEDIPLCRAFVMNRILPGCKYPESVVFAQGHEDGVGCWVSISGEIDCGLFKKPGNPPPNNEDTQPRMLTDLFDLIPGARVGSYLGLRVLVQNRRQKQDTRVVIVGNEILAVGTPRGSVILLEGMKPGETHVKIPHDVNELAGLKPAFISLEIMNGKGIKTGEKPSALIDDKTCSVVLNRGEYAIFEIHYRVGGPRITLDFQALERLAHVQVPWRTSITAASDETVKGLVKAPINQSLVSTHFEDYRLYGKESYITSHYGEARAKMISVGQDAIVNQLGVMIQMAMQG